MQDKYQLKIKIIDGFDITSVQPFIGHITRVCDMNIMYPVCTPQPIQTLHGCM